MQQYHKIQTVYLRDPETKYKTLLDGQFAKPEFDYLQHNQWEFTEKVDGTNIRVEWDGIDVRFGGKTSRAQIPAHLFSTLQDLFPTEAFTDCDMPSLCLYGEGYGAKIQKGGGNYIADGASFILFDVVVGDTWLERSNVIDIAAKLHILSVPIIDQGTLLDGIDMVRNGYASALRETPPEGLVMRPVVELYNRRGERVIAKIKQKDFQ